MGRRWAGGGQEVGKSKRSGARAQSVGQGKGRAWFRGRGGCAGCRGVRIEGLQGPRRLRRLHRGRREGAEGADLHLSVEPHLAAEQRHLAIELDRASLPASAAAFLVRR